LLPASTMCFSAEASFGAAAILAPAGIYCCCQAARKKPSWLPLAVVPLIFGIQQFSEGLVWLGLHRDDDVLVHSASLVFLFPALTLWPFWVPLVMWVKETDPVRRRWLFALTAVSTVWFWVLYFPLISDPATPFTTSIQHHSIHYDLEQLAIRRYLGRGVLQLLYVLTITGALALGSEKVGLGPSLVVAASAVVALVVYWHAFISVWCFFAAVLSAYLVRVFQSLPARALSGRFSPSGPGAFASTAK
jgi:hypothetical protein